MPSPPSASGQQVGRHQPGALEAAADRAGDLGGAERALERIGRDEHGALGDGHGGIVSRFAPWRPSTRSSSSTGTRSGSPTPARSTSRSRAGRRAISPATTSSARTPCSIHLRERPTMLKRFPGGIEAKPIYQKRVPEKRPGVAADGGPEVPVRPRGRGARAGRRRAPAVGGLARQRRLEPAPGPALGPRPPRRAARRHRPDARGAVGPVRRVAMLADEVLREHGLVGFPRTSGSRGMHIMVRIHQRWDFATVRAAALALAREVERARRGDGDVEVVEGGAPAGRGLRRLQPEREGPHGRRGRTRSARCPTRGSPATCAGTRCPTASSATSASTPCRAAAHGRRPERGDRLDRGLAGLAAGAGAPRRRGARARRRAVAAALHRAARGAQARPADRARS